jgi:hypothetical protein
LPLIVICSTNKQWSFLGPNKRAGVPVPRKLLVDRCVVDAGLLHLVCTMTVNDKTGNSALVSFFTAVRACRVCSGLACVT